MWHPKLGISDFSRTKLWSFQWQQQPSPLQTGPAEKNPSETQPRAGLLIPWWGDRNAAGAIKENIHTRSSLAAPIVSNCFSYKRHFKNCTLWKKTIKNRPSNCGILRSMQVRLSLWLCLDILICVKPCRLCFQDPAWFQACTAVVINYSVLQLRFKLMLNLWFLFTRPDWLVQFMELGGISKKVHKILRMLLPNDMGELWELNWYQGMINPG